MKIEIELPFSGFYNSVHDINIEEAIKGGFNYDYEKGEEKEVPEDIFEADIDYEPIFKEYSEKYVEAFGDKFGLDLKFGQLYSPRYYNYGTDRIFAVAKKEQIDKIRKEVEAHEKWPAEVKEQFTSYDGFSSNYSEDSKDNDWTRDVLDPVQYRFLLEFWIDNISTECNSYWSEEEAWLAEDFEMQNWDSVNSAYEAVEKYLEAKK